MDSVYGGCETFLCCNNCPVDVTLRTQICRVHAAGADVPRLTSLNCHFDYVGALLNHVFSSCWNDIVLFPMQSVYNRQKAYLCWLAVSLIDLAWRHKGTFFAELVRSGMTSVAIPLRTCTTSQFYLYRRTTLRPGVVGL